MKKLTVLLACIMAVLFSGCSCSELPALEFSNKWNGNNIGYAETLIYDVNYDDDYLFGTYNLSKGEGLNINCDINGTYTVKTEIFSATNTALPEEVKSSNILGEDVSKIMHVYSELKLNTKYSYGEEENEYEDYIICDAYGLPEDSSFAPVYSKTDYEYSLISNSNGFNFQRIKGTGKIQYGTEEYSVDKEFTDLTSGDTVNEPTRTVKCKTKTTLDNSFLFMAIRNKSFTKDVAVNFPTVHPSYSEGQTLKVRYFDDALIDGTIKVNDEDKAFTGMDTSAISYLINSSEKSGTAQLIFLQKEEYSGVPNKSLIIKYVEPISEYSGFKRLGVLTYQLKEVNFN